VIDTQSHSIFDARYWRHIFFRRIHTNSTDEHSRTIHKCLYRRVKKLTIDRKHRSLFCINYSFRHADGKYLAAIALEAISMRLESNPTDSKLSRTPEWKIQHGMLRVDTIRRKQTRVKVLDRIEWKKFQTALNYSTLRRRRCRAFRYFLARQHYCVCILEFDLQILSRVFHISSSGHITSHVQCNHVINAM